MAQFPFPKLHDYWYTWLDQHVAEPDELYPERPYPWYNWREPYPRKLARGVLNPAELPDPHMYNRQSDVTRPSAAVGTAPLPEDPLKFTVDAYENQQRWFAERGLEFGELYKQRYEAPR